MNCQFKVGDPVMIIGGNDCPENIGKYGAISEIIEGDGEDELTHRVDGETIGPCPIVGDSGHQWCAPHELMLLRGDSDQIEQKAQELVHEQ